jgi:hypothetical protein
MRREPIFLFHEEEEEEEESLGIMETERVISSTKMDLKHVLVYSVTNKFYEITSGEFDVRKLR